MESQKILLDISQENIAEAEFMSANFIDKEVKNRAFINTIGAEAGVSYLANNGVDVEELRNIHSIKRIIEKTNIADIILPNIYIDVRVVFEDDVIFVPKSHFDLEILPNVYMVLKFNQNFENMEFLGYFEPKLINKENCNDEFYFVDASDLYPADNFVDFVKTFEGNTEKQLSESEILRGRELSVSASDDDITVDEYKEFLQLLKSSVILRDSVLEYDNFETLAGSVATFLKDGGVRNAEKSVLENPMTENVENLELSDDLSVNAMDISQMDDPNGDNLIDDDTFNADSDVSLSGVIDTGEISDGGISDEAMQLAGMSGDIENSDSMDIGSADFDLDTSSDETNMDVDLFDNIDDSLDGGFEEEQNDSNEAEISESETPEPEQENEIEDLTLDDSLDLDSGLEDLDLSDADLGDLVTDNDEDNGSDDALELPTEAVTEAVEEESLSLEQDDLLDDNLELSTDDLLPLDEESSEPSEETELPDITTEDASDEETEQESDINENADSSESMQDIKSFINENLPSASFEEYDIENDDNNSKITFEKNINNENTADSFDFSDIEFENTDLNENISQQNDEQANEQDDLYDFASLSELTEEPQDSQPDEFSNNEEVEFSDFDDLNAFVSEQPNESTGGEEVLITDEVINNSVVIENSMVISDKDFEPGEILLDINRKSLPEFENDGIGDLYNNPENAPQSGLNNGVRIGSRSFNISSIPPKYGVIGLFLIILTAGIILFSVAKVMNKPQEEPQPVTGSLNPESKVNENTPDAINVDPNNVVMNDDNNVKTADLPVERQRKNTTEEVVPSRPAKPIPPTSFLTVKRLTWEVPDYVSYSGEFRQFFQSSGKSLKTALSSDLLLATDYTYSNLIKLSITFDKNGKFTDAKIISSSGSADVDKIVLQSVNQTLNILKAPNSLENNENTTVILKIYL